MGAGIAASISYVGSEEAWAKNDRGPKLRQLFGLYRSQDCWAVMRKFRQIDDGNGYVSWDEFEQLLCLPEFHLLFIWDVYSQQNELIDAREFLTMVCLFSSARLEEKGRFLISLFDSTQTGRCTGAELGQLCVMVLTVLAKCTGALVKPKDVVPRIREELPGLVPEYGARVAEDGNDAWHKVRVVGQLELDRILPTIAAAYEALPLAGPPPDGAAPPPSETWAAAPMQGAAAAAEARRTNASDKAKSLSKLVRKDQPAAGLQVTQQPKQSDLAHLSWLRKLDDEPCSPQARVEQEVSREDGLNATGLMAPAHCWLFLHGKDFGSIAKDIRGFRILFAKSVSHSLGLPTDCIEVLNVTSGSIVVEFIMQPSGRNGDERSSSALLSLLEQQLKNPHSAIRKGAFGAYTDKAELMSGEPKRASMATMRDRGLAR